MQKKISNDSPVADAKIITKDNEVLRFFQRYGEIIEAPSVSYKKVEGEPKETRGTIIITDLLVGGHEGKDIIAEPVTETNYYLVLKKGPGFSTDAVRREAKRSLYGHEFSFIPYR